MSSDDEVYGASPVKSKIRRTNAELAIIDEAIIAAVAEQHPVSVRGVFYRLVSALAGQPRLVPKDKSGYDVVYRQLLKLRRSGEVPYGHIADGTRWVVQPRSYDGVDDALNETADTYRRALWRNQDVRVQIFSEKDAITGVVEPVTMSWHVPLGIARGFSSETFAYNIAESLIDLIRAGKPVCVYNLGDHDYSGVAAWRALKKRIFQFIEARLGEHEGSDDDVYDRLGVHFKRLAVTPGQIEEFGLPIREPTKRDKKMGWVGGCVEVDAIPPNKLRELVEQAITQHLDEDKLALTLIAEESERDILYRMAGRR